MNYTKYHFTISPLEPFREILVAELGLLEFESFEDTENGLKAYIQTEVKPANLIEEVQILNSPEVSISVEVTDLETKNWNAIWESSFEPIYIGEKCAVRAEFHPEKPVDYDIVITPKMAFGTGHHATTYMILKLIFEDEFKQLNGLDMGCGTGVLGILALMKDAHQVDFIDIDDWCIDNTEENLDRNQLTGICTQGDAQTIKSNYDFIFANINRNILLDDMPTYVRHLNQNGNIYFSGFYKEDLDQIINRADELGLTYVKHLLKDDWCAAKFELSS